jgi:sodium/proline symporter
MVSDGSIAGMILFLISFCIYTAFVVGVGLWSSSRAGKSDEEYFLAGRSLGPWVASLSASASSESGWVTLGLVGWAFASGVQAFWILPGSLLGFAFNWFVLADRMRDASANLGAVTIPDFLSKRFKERIPVIRVMSVIVILAAMLLYCAAQFAAAGKAFDVAFESVSYQGGVLIGAMIVVVYVTLGGFRAACWTDLVQGLLMVGVLAVFPLWLLSGGGGVSDIRGGLAEGGGTLLTFWPTAAGGALIGFLLGSGAFGINFGYMGQPHVLVRFMAMRSRRDVALGGVISMTWAALVLSGAVATGIIVRSVAEQGAPWAAGMLASGDGEYALVAAAVNLAPPLIGGLVLAAILAAICSTADSQLVVAASAFANDLWAKLFARESGHNHAIANRVTVVAMGAAAVLLVIDSQITIYDYVLTYGWAILGASFGPQIILAVFWKRATLAGCGAGMATGFLVALLWKLIMDNQIQVGEQDIEVYNLPLAFIAALLINVGVSLITPTPRSV